MQTYERTVCIDCSHCITVEVGEGEGLYSGTGSGGAELLPYTLSHMKRNRGAYNILRIFIKSSPPLFVFNGNTFTVCNLVMTLYSPISKSRSRK